MKPNLNNKPLIKQGWLRVVLFIIFYFTLLVFASSVLKLTETKAPATADKNITAQTFSYLQFIVNAVISVAAVLLFRKLIDGKSLESMGFTIDKNGSNAGTGFFLGILLLCTGTCILFFSNNLAWTNISFNANDLFIGFGLMVIVAFNEEMIMRGYVLNNLMDSVNKWPALFISALIFALLHIANPGFSVVGACNIFLAGILLGINYIYTKNLWFGIMLHFTWNFFQGPILGYDVSGLKLQSLFEHEVLGSELITGGKFGFEGSLVATILCLIAIAMLAFVYQKKYAAAVENVIPV